MDELVFEVVQEADGGYCAECLTESIFTDGDSWEQLRKNVLEATTAFYFDRPGQRVAIPDHDPVRIGTLVSILRSVAGHKGVTRDAIIKSL